ncbi:MAG TPA: biopolymer transporter ExbD [Candidatus Acidoferrales bacterium]|nr:biopolymer transporter ExbD [Candidatus Acidoferrales bacterium]HEV2298828.1 biopolymer transporter ExbD [Candidatus Acidoferrales bacterium]
MPQLSRQPGTTLSDINIVPFVDVMLVLLVIFMITAPILESGIRVELPKTKTVKEITQARIIVTIDRAQRLYLGNDPVNIHELGKKVLAEDKDVKNTPVYVRCDSQVPFAVWAMVMDTLRQSGINNISVVTKPLNGEPRTE